ncbi:hypothetical protein BU15DRAFT_68988 [Melanogaster broomeanus]|nr:hypothetical protein BU15DRAFT_68988 [Melanogaster broomeanus]
MSDPGDAAAAKGSPPRARTAPDGSILQSTPSSRGLSAASEAALESIAVEVTATGAMILQDVRNAQTCKTGQVPRAVVAAFLSQFCNGDVGSDTAGLSPLIRTALTEYAKCTTSQNSEYRRHYVPLQASAYTCFSNRPMGLIPETQQPPKGSPHAHAQLQMAAYFSLLQAVEVFLLQAKQFGIHSGEVTATGAIDFGKTFRNAQTCKTGQVPRAVVAACFLRDPVPPAEALLNKCLDGSFLPILQRGPPSVQVEHLKTLKYRRHTCPASERIDMFFQRNDPKWITQKHSGENKAQTQTRSRHSSFH